jgi:hypothetical protein
MTCGIYKLTSPSSNIYDDFSRQLFNLVPIRYKNTSAIEIMVKINGTEYNSASEASLALGEHTNTILRRARSKLKKFNNYQLI